MNITTTCPLSDSPAVRICDQPPQLLCLQMGRLLSSAGSLGLTSGDWWTWGTVDMIFLNPGWRRWWGVGFLGQVLSAQNSTRPCCVWRLFGFQPSLVGWELRGLFETARVCTQRWGSCQQHCWGRQWLCWMYVGARVVGVDLLAAEIFLLGNCEVVVSKRGLFWVRCSVLRAADVCAPPARSWELRAHGGYARRRSCGVRCCSFDCGEGGLRVLGWAAETTKACVVFPHGRALCCQCEVIPLFLSCRF